MRRRQVNRDAGMIGLFLPFCRPEPEFETEAQVILRGDVALATNPFELLGYCGTRMRCRSRALQAFLVQLANGNGGYPPMPPALDHGQYSALTKSDRVGPEGGRTLVAEIVATISRLLGDRKYERTR